LLLWIQDNFLFLDSLVCLRSAQIDSFIYHVYDKFPSQITKISLGRMTWNLPCILMSSMWWHGDLLCLVHRTQARVCRFCTLNALWRPLFSQSLELNWENWKERKKEWQVFDIPVVTMLYFFFGSTGIWIQGLCSVIRAMLSALFFGHFCVRLSGICLGQTGQWPSNLHFLCS
jgi:hypothetical protein